MTNKFIHEQVIRLALYSMEGKKDDKECNCHPRNNIK